LDHAWFTTEVTYSFAELMKSMSTVGSVIATRYHNVLCALKLGKPTVAVAYSRKHNVLMEDMGMAEYCQPIKSLDVDLLLEQLDRMAANQAELRQTMRERHTVKAELLERQFTELSKVLFPASGAGPQIAERTHSESGARQRRMLKLIGRKLWPITPIPGE
jgi:polysaccharide pyruvyl transferase WcaK-like protein